MRTLTRKRLDTGHQRSWGVFYDGVLVGTISQRVGNPPGTDVWQWSCGFFPGCEPGEQRVGTSATFAFARAAFHRAWDQLLPRKTAADFEAWREQQKQTAEKYARFDRGERPPPYDGIMACPCGRKFNERDPAQSIIHVPHIEAARKDGSYHVWARSTF